MSNGLNITIDIRNVGNISNVGNVHFVQYGQDVVQNPQVVVQDPQDFVHIPPENPPPYSSIGQPQSQMEFPSAPPSVSYPNNMGWNQDQSLPPPQQQQQPTSQVIIATPIVGQPIKVKPIGPDSFLTICPNCQHEIATMVKTETSMVQHIWAFVLCIIG